MVKWIHQHQWLRNDRILISDWSVNYALDLQISNQ
jgi:hypothetical protein